MVRESDDERDVVVLVVVDEVVGRHVGAFGGKGEGFVHTLVRS